MRGHALRLLIVDDSTPIRHSLKNLLHTIPDVQIVGEADTAAKAIHITQRLKPDVVILDISLPDQSGFDVLRVIKSSEPTPRVIVMTNYSSKQFREKGRRDGADYFFDKSDEFEKIVDVIRQMRQSNHSETVDSR